MNLLKEAELDASKLVAEARNYRVEKLRLAKANADASIENYSKELEAAHESSVSQNSNTNEFAELNSSADKDISSMGQDFASNKDKVEKFLVDLVCKTN